MSLLDNVKSMFNFPDTKSLSKEECIRILKADPEKFAEFEKKYQIVSNEEDKALINRPQTNAVVDLSDTVEDIVKRIVTGCLLDTCPELVEHPETFVPVELDEMMALPEYIRPQFTERYYIKDCAGENYKELLWFYQQYKEAKNPAKALQAYNHFRQGLDLLDLDFVMYKMLEQNPNSISKWFPALQEAVGKQDFFKVPDTVIRRIPLPMLQMTRVQYENLNPVTLRIVDEFCKKAFLLDNTKEYFVKNGVYSNKFNFRNARVIPSEVDTLGEYLLFIHSMATSMAGPLNPTSIYGPATTNEWCVREFIDTTDTTDDFTKIRQGGAITQEVHDYIYHGLELRNELRAFVDFDTREILGIVQYWDPEVMKNRFDHAPDSEMPTMKHDSIVFGVYEDVLTKRFNETKSIIREKLQVVVDNMNLRGQWSIDIMEKKSVKDYSKMDGESHDDFYIIDMALAAQSAFSEKFKGKLLPVNENWLPAIK